ncbi:AhpC/TSA family protein [Sphingobacterium kitahiroshimense]|uniref:TlpA disulfide reductase family protein n=1 Tax=Sphingobacterium sp. B16(2022) TaxID=2914044 RepID=UPI00143B8F34|nr:TlpA disulfide reductase family protein [Sphingobacterium sp. B16(2022)]NJI72340.1 AhpC/TSA family protein [Sphingobacterium sp. B16(2022)]
MKAITHLTLALLGSISTLYAQEKASYLIQGTLNGVPKEQKGMLFLQRYDADFSLDSARIDQGTFRFKGTVQGPEMANLFYINTLGERSETLDFYIEKGKITINGTLGNFHKARISGSALNSDAQQFDETHKTIIDHISTLTTEYFKAEEILSQDSFSMDSPARAIINKIDVDLNKWSAQLSKEQATYIDQHPNDALSLFKLERLLKDTANQQLVTTLYEKLNPKLKSTPLGQQLLEQLRNLDNLKMGDIAPEFALADTTGKQINLHDFRGKYVLIDFWASWCVPCRVENEHVQKAYDTYKDNGFEVLGISTDMMLDSWKKAVTDDGMTWVNVVDPESKVSGQYHIKSIPSNFLLDPTGKIIGINLRGEALHESLKNIF